MPYVARSPGAPATLGWVQLAVAAVPVVTKGLSKLFGKKKRKRQRAAQAAAEEQERLRAEAESQQQQAAALQAQIAAAQASSRPVRRPQRRTVTRRQSAGNGSRMLLQPIPGAGGVSPALLLGGLLAVALIARRK